MKNGFSLAELAVAIALIALSLGLVLVNVRDTRGSARLAAQVLAAELRAARAQAQATGIPTAVAFPNDGNSRPHSQAFAILQGFRYPKVRRVVSLANEAPGSYFFVGHWENGGLNQIGADRGDLNGSQFQVASWQPPPDWTPLVFLPSGALATEMAVFDQACHIVCLDGLDYSPASLAGRESFLLQRAADPYTVRVGVMGTITVISGIPEGASVTGRPPGPPATAPAPSNYPTTAGNNLPVATASLFPDPNPATLPAGASATVKLSGFVSLAVEAEDQDGDPLFIEWSTPDGGTFSTPERTRMEWDTATMNWRSLHQWEPGPEAQPGDQFTLEYEVTDDQGGSAQGRIGLTGVVEVLPEGRIIFVADVLGDGNREICAINADGTDLTNLTDHPDDDLYCSWSQDGSRIVFCSRRDADYRIYIMNGDGSNVRSLVDPSDHGLWWVSHPRLDPTGTRLAFMGMSPDDAYEHYLINLDGSEPLDIGMAPTHAGVTGLRQAGVSGMSRDVHVLSEPVWSPDGNYLLTTGGPILLRPNGRGGFNEYPDGLHLVDLVSPGCPWTRLMHDPGLFEFSPRFLPDSNDILFIQERDPTTSRTFRASLDLTTATLGTPTEQTWQVAGPIPSPDGQFVCNTGWGNIVVSQVDGTSRRTLLSTGIGGGYADWAWTY